ncbi:hypothetical protein EZV62_027864 [Acer yangbiense]|uniref:PGG domain-containing protein n=1 Tax=Acer yangbiense TaxID=1000413 RepID=A0A5C7GQN0_9ROSI|nr:hypothetical protein EZV62_027864 [Acer yangbiense]
MVHLRFGDFEDVLVLGTTTLLLNDKRILKSKQDQQGWTPLHLAAHFGYIVILKLLLIKDRSAAYKADNEGKTALHVAAGLGRVVGLILRNPLLGNLVNEKDEKGNTPFLHAASLRFIINHSKVDEKVFNNENQNAEDMIDLLTIFPWNSRLDIILWLFGTSSRIIRNGRLFMSKDDDKEGKENRVDSVSSNSYSSNEDGVGKNYLVVATLIATVTFAAGFTVPGGFEANEGPTQGAAILTKNRAFQAFVIFNTLSMFLSSLAVFNHLSIRPATRKTEIYRRMSFRDLLIRYAMLAMIGAFLAGTCAVLHNDQKLAINACLVPVAVYLFIRVRIKRCRRIMFNEDNDEEGRENKGDPVSSKSNTGLGPNHLVVAILIATITFAAGITVPGSSYVIVAHLAGRHTTNKVKIINRRMVLQGFIAYAMWAMIGAFLAGTCAGEGRLYVVWHDRRNEAVSIDLDGGDSSTLMGIVINVPVTRSAGIWKGRHWITLRKIDGRWSRSREGAERFGSIFEGDLFGGVDGGNGVDDDGRGKEVEDPKEGEVTDLEEPEEDQFRGNSIGEVVSFGGIELDAVEVFVLKRIFK